MEALPALLFFIVLFFIPESPRWLVVKGKEKKASSILNRIYGKDEARIQIGNIKNLIASETQTNWRMLIPARIPAGALHRCRLGNARSAHGSQCSSLLRTYQFLRKAACQAGIRCFTRSLVGLVNMLTTVLALIIIDKVGRKKLVYWGVSGMIIALLLIGIYFAYGAETRNPASVSSDIFPLLYFLLCHFDLCCDFCPSFRDVPCQGKGSSHVDSRTFTLDRHLPDRTAYPCDADISYARRYLLAFCRHVYSVYTDRVETVA